MQSEESNTLVKLAKAVIEHAPEGGDAFWDIKFSDIEAALSAAEPVAELQSIDARELDEAIQLLPSVMRPSLSKVIISAIEEQRRIIAYFKRTSRARQLAFEAATVPSPPAPSVAEEIADAVLSWMVRYDLLDAGNEYRAADVVAVLDDFKPSYHAALSAQVQDVAERKPLDLNVTKEWFEKRAALEGDHEIGAGRRKLTASIDPTPEELAELYRIAHRIPEGWQLVPAEPTAGMIEAAKSTTSAALTRSHATEIYRAMLAAAPAKQEG